MVGSCLSLVPVYKGYLRRSFAAVGLSPQFLAIDSLTTIHFWGPPPPLTTTTTNKPVLLLIHGFGPNTMWQWHHQVPCFASHFTLYVPELVFFGESTTKSLHRSDVFQAMAMARLMEKVGVEKYFVMGTSYGGFVAYHMARLWPERVEKVVIGNAGLNKKWSDYGELAEIANVERIEDLLVPRTVKHLKALIGLSLLKKPLVLPDFFLSDLLKVMYIENREEKMELFAGITLGRDEDTKLSPLQQEVLIVWGLYDEIFRLERAFKLKEILGENVALEVLKNTGHMPHVEDPNRFNEIVKRFLSAPS